MADLDAPSDPNVLVNAYSYCELYSSAHAPLVFWFDPLVSEVDMMLGTTEAPDCDACLGNYPATVSFQDCAGTVLSTVQVTVSRAFDTPVQFNDPLGRIHKVVVDYGASMCPEALDELWFEPAASQCSDIIPPTVAITSHTNNQTLIQNAIVLEGTAGDNSGILEEIRVNGCAAVLKPYVQAGGKLAAEARRLRREPVLRRRSDRPQSL